MTKTTFRLNPLLSFTLGRNHGVPEWLYCWVCVPGGVSSGLLYTPEDAHLFRFGVRAVLEFCPVETLVDGLSVAELVELWKLGWILSPDQTWAQTEAPLSHHVVDDGGDGSAAFIPSGRDQVQRLAPTLEDQLYRMPRPTGEGREAEAAAMAATGVTEIAPLIGPACAAAVTGWYKTLLARGIMTKYNPKKGRHNFYNDPVGRTLLHHLHPVLSAVAGTPLRPTYSYAAIYGDGATLPWHIDRDECEFSLSLFLAHTPEPDDGRNPWRLDFIVDESQPPLSLYPLVGGGGFFRGHRIRHARPDLEPGRECIALMLHYVYPDYPATRRA